MPLPPAPSVHALCDALGQAALVEFLELDTEHHAQQHHAAHRDKTYATAAAFVCMGVGW